MNANKGYLGYSMSVRAASAYENGEKPLSKWKKSDIIAEVEEIKEDLELGFSMELFQKLNMETLKREVLMYSSWHHTSSKFNETDFYSIDIDYIENLTDTKILELLEEQKASRKPRKKLSDEEKAIKKAEKEKQEQEKADRAFKRKLIDYQKKYRKISSFLNSDTDFGKLAKIREEKIAIRREELRKIWEKQLPDTEYQLSRINEDEFIENYIHDKTD